MRAVMPSILLGLAIAIVTPARADDTVTACLRAHMEGQKLRKTGHLSAAHTAFAKCAEATCPEGPRGDCAEWLNEVDRTVPTIVLGVRDDARDVTDATVSIDGAPTLRRLDGRALALDPGEHVLGVRLPDGRQQQQTIVVREGEKSRLISFEFQASHVVDAGTPHVVSADITPSRSVPTATYVLLGVGLVSAGVFTIFGLDGRGRQTSLEQDACHATRTCAESRVDAMYRSYAIADVALATAAISIGAALVIYLLRPERSTTSHAGLLDHRMLFTREF